MKLPGSSDTKPDRNTVAVRVAGLTLVEVMIAVSILAIGVLAVFGLQASALRGTRSATIIQELSNLAQSELQLQRQFARHVNEPVWNETCLSGVALGAFSCTVNVLPCDLAANVITCHTTSVAGAVARQIDVVVTGPGNETFRASAVVR